MLYVSNYSVHQESDQNPSLRTAKSFLLFCIEYFTDRLVGLRDCSLRDAVAL